MENVETLFGMIKTFQGLRISAADLRALSTDTVVPIYLEFLKSFGFDVESLKNPLSSEPKFHISHYDPDLRFIMKLYSVLNVILKGCAGFEVDLMDILHPGLARTTTIASVLYNLILFKNSRKETIDEIVEKGSEKIEKFRRMTAMIDKRRNDINYQSKEKAELLMLRDQLKRQMAEAEERLFVAIEERQNITESIEHITKTLAEYDHKISKLEAECSKLSQTIEKLKNQIVSSPQQLVQNLENLKAIEQQLKEKEQEISEVIQKKKSRCENLTVCAHLGNAVREEIKDLNKLLDEIRHEEMDMERLEMEKTKLNEEAIVKKEVINLVNNTEVEQQQKIKSLKEQLADKKDKAQKKLKQIEKLLAKHENSMDETMRIMKDRTKQFEEYKCNFTIEQDRQSGTLQEIKNESEDIILEVKMLTHSFIHFSETLSGLESCKI